MAKNVVRSVHPSSLTPMTAARTDELLELARAAGNGNPDAVTTLVTALGGAMLRTVRKVLGPGHSDIEDVTQDAVIALVSTLSNFRGDCTVMHFAHRVALLTALAARRRLRTRDRWTELDASATEFVAADDKLSSPLTGTIGKRRRAIVLNLLDDLAEPIAEALALHFVLGYTVDEIAASASVPPNTVWSRLRLGKAALRKKLERDTQLAEALQSRE